jgi:hypothetical protein
MNNPELTKWLRRVRDALAESDEVRRNSMSQQRGSSKRAINNGIEALQSPYLANNGFGVTGETCHQLAIKTRQFGGCFGPFRVRKS